MHIIRPSNIIFLSILLGSSFCAAIGIKSWKGKDREAVVDTAFQKNGKNDASKFQKGDRGKVRKAFGANVLRTTRKDPRRSVVRVRPDKLTFQDIMDEKASIFGADFDGAMDVEKMNQFMSMSPGAMSMSMSMPTNVPASSFTGKDRTSKSNKTSQPTKRLTNNPTKRPATSPTPLPSPRPTTQLRTSLIDPTSAPVNLTVPPTFSPIIISAPVNAPEPPTVSSIPSSSPSEVPSVSLSSFPSSGPSAYPSNVPTSGPISVPSINPSASPSDAPSTSPSKSASGSVPPGSSTSVDQTAPPTASPPLAPVDPAATTLTPTIMSTKSGSPSSSN
mmetsp:Transcript_51020/g.51965  ORF Transcript_51020/g.51965 Transcript_51020/m.51965 type:complete len:332 (+) Transcript_51020:409-1404(+)